MRSGLVVVSLGFGVLTGCYTPSGPSFGGGRPGTAGFPSGTQSGAADLDPGTLAFSTTSGADTHGLHIPDGRQWAAAGMSGLTCQLDMAFGGTGTDLNIDPGDEQVVDGNGQIVLIATLRDHYQVVNFPSGNFGDDWSVPTGGVSRLTDGGHVDVALEHGSCDVSFHGDVQGTVALPEAYCTNGGDVAVSADGTVWVGADETIARVTPDGYVEVPVGGQTLAVDSLTGAVLVTSVGSSVVTGLLADGSVAWRNDAGGVVAGMNARDGQAVVVLDGSTSSDSVLVVLDTLTGAETSRQGARGIPSGSVEMSDTFVAVESAQRFDFFRLQ